jgi:hypothetical protein
MYKIIYKYFVIFIIGFVLRIFINNICYINIYYYDNACSILVSSLLLIISYIILFLEMLDPSFKLFITNLRVFNKITISSLYSKVDSPTQYTIRNINNKYITKPDLRYKN